MHNMQIIKQYFNKYTEYALSLVQYAKYIKNYVE